MSARKLLLGDWSRLIRDPIDVLRLGLVAAAAVLASLGDAGWKNAAVGAAAALAVRPIDLPRVYDLSFVLAMGLVGLGEGLRLYGAWGSFDVLVHLLVPLLGAPVVYIVLARLEVLRDLAEESRGSHRAGIFVITFSLGLSLGAIWEGVEWTADHLTGSHLQLGLDDTMGDLAADAVGAAVGGALLVAWTVWGWASVRRIEGDNRAEAKRA